MHALTRAEGAAPTIDDVHAAAERIRGQVIATPCLHSRTLSALTGAEIYVKFENFQFTASFKERGALNSLLQLGDRARRRGVVTASAGNHGQAVAYHSHRLGIPATVVMPRHTPFVKVEHTRAHGALVLLEGETLVQSFANQQQHGIRRRGFCVLPDRGFPSVTRNDTHVQLLPAPRQDMEIDYSCLVSNCPLPAPALSRQQSTPKSGLP